MIKFSIINEFVSMLEYIQDLANLEDKVWKSLLN